MNFDQAIIEGICKGESKYEDLLFNRFRGIEDYFDEPEDVRFSLYVDSITDIILFIRRNCKETDFSIDNLRAYLKSVMQNKYNGYLKLKIKDRERYADLDTQLIGDMVTDELPDSLLDVSTEEKIHKTVEELLAKLSEKCKEIFKARFVERKRFSEIAKELNYSGENSAKSANHDCLQTAREKGKTIIKEYYDL